MDGGGSGGVGFLGGGDMACGRACVATRGVATQAVWVLHTCASVIFRVDCLKSCTDAKVKVVSSCGFIYR